MRDRDVPIPPPHPALFRGAIAHPDVWLWDSWTASLGEATDLYCLALARVSRDGTPVLPAHRNSYFFHVRRFRSHDAGETFKDEGCVIAPSRACGGAFARNVWSGSALDLADGRRLHAFTGVREVGRGRSFLQTLFLASAPTPLAPPQPASRALLCPDRDYRRIRAAGYYLADRARLGADEGEDGGPILAWRDPFLMHAPDGVELFWSAKLDPNTPAIGSARLVERRGEWRVETLRPPMPLPDASAMRQAEVPKVYCDQARKAFLLLISASDRANEAQPDSEVSKELRLYRSDSSEGPWRPWNGADSLLVGAEHAFGASAMDVDFTAERLQLVLPLTEQAPPPLQLTIAATRSIAFAQEGTARRRAD